VLSGTAWAPGVHPRNCRCLPPGQNPLKGEPKPQICPRIRESERKNNTGPDYLSHAVPCVAHTSFDQSMYHISAHPCTPLKVHHVSSAALSGLAICEEARVLPADQACQAQVFDARGGELVKLSHDNCRQMSAWQAQYMHEM
jgi:hypothetical protein